LEVDAKEFFELLKKRDVKKAREWIEARRDLVQGDDFARGYVLALQGMVLAFEDGGEEVLVKRVLDGRQNVEALIMEINERLSLKFRPEDEQGFDRAWLDFLQGLKG